MILDITIQFNTSDGEIYTYQFGNHKKCKQGKYILVSHNNSKILETKQKIKELLEELHIAR